MIVGFNGWNDSINRWIQFYWNVLWSSRVGVKSNRWCCSPCDCIGWHTRCSIKWFAIVK